MAGQRNRSQKLLQQRWRRVASTHNLVVGPFCAKCLAECRNPDRDLLEDKDDYPEIPRMKLIILGTFLILFACFFLGFLTFSYLVKLPQMQDIIPSDGIVNWVASDWYYCFLIPLAIPSSTAMIVINWFSMKFFKHNS